LALGILLGSVLLVTVFAEGCHFAIYEIELHSQPKEQQMEAMIALQHR